MTCQRREGEDFHYCFHPECNLRPTTWAEAVKAYREIVERIRKDAPWFQVADPEQTIQRLQGPGK